MEQHHTDSAATSPGAILKRCREYHEITLEEAAESTKIGENYLRSLEEDQIGDFASQAYLKGFLRIYATYLGLSPDDMIRLFDKLYLPGDASASTTSSQRGTVDGSAPAKKLPLQKLFLPAVFLLLILITSAIINRSPGKTGVVSQQPSNPPTASVIAIQSPRSSSRLAPAIPKQREPAPEPVTSEPPPAQQQTKTTAESSHSFVVRMKVSQGGTLVVTIDGASPQNYDLLVGDSIEWKAERSMTLELSNAGGVETELNGRKLSSFGQSGKPAVITLDADGVRR